MTLTADYQWLQMLEKVMESQNVVNPRGKTCREVLNYKSVVDMQFPIVTVRQRKLGYKFMAAEAYWILTGDNRVETIKPYSKAIETFSDDGKTFFGAYGPKVVDQLLYVVETLAKDQDTRQAVMTIWRENPPASKDIPCTVAVQFIIRNRRLNCIDNMRSSDAWLGWPYDVFNFTMLSYYIILTLSIDFGIHLLPGLLYMNCGSQHVYSENYAGVEECLRRPAVKWPLNSVGKLLGFGATSQLLEWLAEKKKTGGLNPWGSD